MEKHFDCYFFFSGLRIRIVAEDTANAEDSVTDRCKHSSFKPIVFIQSGNPVFFFFSNESLAYEKITQKNHINWMKIED